MTRLYGKVAFVEALLYVGRYSMEIQHALCVPFLWPLLSNAYALCMS